ncbi:MAG: surface lipoprotein assembly modifier [Paracoccaceae bacterium]
MRRFLRPLLPLGAVVALAAPVGAEPVRLTPDNMVQLTLLLLEHHRPAEALRFSQAMLDHDPQDVTALVLKSRAERDLGRYRAATATGRLAWRHAEGGGERYGAALAIAQGLSSDGQKFRAQFWLRRAMQEAPDPAARAAAERDFRYVRARSRLSLRFDLSVRPSSNVNGGSAADFIDFYGIPLTLSPDAKALSGVQGQASVTARWRTAESETAKTDLRFGWVEQQVALSGTARREAPMARGSDYAYAALELGVDQAWKLAGGEATASATLGHNWYGGADMSDYARLDLGFSHGLGAGMAGNLGLSVERQDRLDVARRSATITELSAGAQKILPGRDQLRFQLTARDSRSDAAEIDHTALAADLGWSRAAPVLGAGLDLGLTAEARDYPRSLYDPDGREDMRLSARVSLTLDKIDYMGFVPVVSLQAQKVNSNVSIYRMNSVGIGVSVRSRF